MTSRMMPASYLEQNNTLTANCSALYAGSLAQNEYALTYTGCTGGGVVLQVNLASTAGTVIVIK